VSEALGRFLFQQLVLALDFCHRRGKVCRGVKLANTLLALAPGQLPLVKLADFGFSKDVGQHGAPQSQVGSLLLLYAGDMLCMHGLIQYLNSFQSKHCFL
jgi:serine/threonine-protein kinase SRK2